LQIHLEYRDSYLKFMLFEHLFATCLKEFFFPIFIIADDFNHSNWELLI